MQNYIVLSGGVQMLDIEWCVCITMHVSWRGVHLTNACGLPCVLYTSCRWNETFLIHRTFGQLRV